MTEPRYITPCGPFDEPMSHVRVAVLTVTIALSALVSAELSVDRPLMTHAVKIDLPINWGNSDWPRPAPAPTHVLRIDASGGLIFNGAPCRDLVELRRLLDADQMMNPIPMLRVEPDPTTRYDNFIKVVAVMKRAHVFKFCIDFDPERLLTKEVICRPWLPVE